MCMEDIRLGRKKYSRLTQYLCDGAGNAEIPADPLRTGIRIGGSGAVNVFISDKPAPTAATGFLAVVGADPQPFVADVEDTGNFVRQSIFVFIAAAATLTCIETALEEK